MRQFIRKEKDTMVKDLRGIKDMDLAERLQLAREGKRLDELVTDSSYRVRKAVALQGYGLEILKDDKSEVVRKAARRLLDKKKDGDSGLFDEAPIAEGVITEDIDSSKIVVSGCGTKRKQISGIEGKILKAVEGLGIFEKGSSNDLLIVDTVVKICGKLDGLPDMVVNRAKKDFADILNVIAKDMSATLDDGRDYSVADMAISAIDG